MKSFFSLCATALIGLAFSSAQAAAKEVIEPVGAKPCLVKVGDTVRIPVTGIAGSKIEVTVNGMAGKTEVTRVIKRAGGSNVVGTVVEDHEFKPEAGASKVKVKVSPPNGDAIETEYTIEAK